MYLVLLHTFASCWLTQALAQKLRGSKAIADVVEDVNKVTSVAIACSKCV